MASAVNQVKGILGNLNQELRLKADREIMEKLATKLPQAYNKDCYSHLHEKNKTISHWEMFEKWLSKDEGVAYTTHLELLLTSTATTQTSKPPAIKLNNTLQVWSDKDEEEDMQHKTSCAISTVHRRWVL